MKIGIISHNTQDANNFLNTLLGSFPVEEIEQMGFNARRKYVFLGNGMHYEVLDSDLDLIKGYKAIRFYLSKKLSESYAIELSFRCREDKLALSPFIIYF